MNEEETKAFEKVIEIVVALLKRNGANVIELDVNPALSGRLLFEMIANDMEQLLEER